MTPMERITCPCGNRESLEKAVNIAGFLRCQSCQQDMKTQMSEERLKEFAKRTHYSLLDLRTAMEKLPQKFRTVGIMNHLVYIAQATHADIVVKAWDIKILLNEQH